MKFTLPIFYCPLIVHEQGSYFLKLPLMYRPMTLIEKQQLRKLIQKLPVKNLDRVVQIIQHSKIAKTQSRDEIFVNLEKEVNKLPKCVINFIKSF